MLLRAIIVALGLMLAPITLVSTMVAIPHAREAMLPKPPGVYSAVTGQLKPAAVTSKEDDRLPVRRVTTVSYRYDPSVKVKGKPQKKKRRVARR